MEELTLAPDLNVSVGWSWRMQEIWRKYYADLLHGRPCTDEQLSREYNLWQRKLQASHRHIQRFFELTGSLPVVGDLLSVRVMDGDKWDYEILSIEARILFACSSIDEVRVTYEVQSNCINILEIQEGRMEAKEGWF
jgi:hypothetical protein